MSEFLLQNGLIDLNGRFFTGDVLLQGGKIAAIGTQLSTTTASVINLDGALVTPGLVDLHVHLRDPGQTTKETIATGSMAAARGGFTTIGAMPNVEPVPDDAAKISTMVRRNAAEGHVHIKQYASITHNRAEGATVDFAAVAHAGAFAVSNDGSGVQDAATMWAALQGAAAAGLPLAAHVEENSLKFGGVINAGAKADALGVPGALGVVETSQLARDLALAQASGAPYHMCHASLATSVEMIRRAKAAGVRVTAEVTPHHLLFTDAEIPGDDANYKMNPPLRGEADRQALIAGLLDGTLDCIATDHAPHTDGEKAAGLCGAPNGITGSETAFASLYTRYVKDEHVFTLGQLLKWMTSAPATIFKLPNCGTLIPGAPADVAVFDIAHAATVNAADFASKGHNTPLVGRRLFGATLYTFVDGKMIYSREEHK